MSNTLSKILTLAADLSKNELLMLNQAIVSLIKSTQDTEVKTAALNFNKGDIVSFKDPQGFNLQGVITKKNPKTLQVTTPDKYYVNVPANFVSQITKPSKKLLEFKRSLFPTEQDFIELLQLNKSAVNSKK